MLKNYLKLTLRNLLKHRLYATINLTGLAIGFAAALAMGLYSFYVLNYDRFHKNADSIYAVYKERITPNGVQATYDTWVPLLKELTFDFPQISLASRVFSDESKVLVDENEFREMVMLADPAFFKMFSFHPIRGNRNNPLSDHNSVVISTEMALKFFGRIDVVGESLRIKNRNFELDDDYLISAVLEEFPSNSYLDPAIVIPFESIPVYGEIENMWQSSFIITYVMLNDKRSRREIEAGFPDFIEKTWDAKTRNNTNLKLLPLVQNYDVFIGDTDNAYILLYAGIGIVLMAMANFINLATANSTDRAKEIGIKKILGAMSGQLRMQILTESVLTSLSSLFCAIILVYAALPYVNDLIQMELSLGPVLSGMGLVGLILAGVVLGVLSGLYPAFYLSKFKAFNVLREASAAKSKNVLRNGLVIFQFSLATLLVIGTLVVNSQIGFMTSSNMGFNPDNLVIIPYDDSDFESREIQTNRMNTFLGELEQLPFVEKVSSSRHIPTQWSGSFTFVRPEGWNDDPMRMRYTYHDAQFFDAYGMEIVDGQAFDANRESSQQNSVILNEAAMEAFGWKDFHDKAIKIGRNKRDIVGVVRNFHFETLRNEIQPTIHMYRRGGHTVHRYVSVKVNPGKLQQARTVIGERWQKVNPDIPFDPVFIDQNTARMYEEESRLLKLSGLFTAVGLAVAALGLYGLTFFILEKRAREISIRKVVGATVADILRLIAKYFGILTILGFAIGGAIAFYLTGSWLENFSFRIGTPWSTYALSLGLILIVVLITVAYRSLKVASTNPVEYLRKE